MNPALHGRKEGINRPTAQPEETDEQKNRATELRAKRFPRSETDEVEPLPKPAPEPGMGMSPFVLRRLTDLSVDMTGARCVIEAAHWYWDGPMLFQRRH